MKFFPKIGLMVASALALATLMSLNLVLEEEEEERSMEEDVLAGVRTRRITLGSMGLMPDPTAGRVKKKEEEEEENQG